MIRKGSFTTATEASRRCGGGSWDEADGREVAVLVHFLIRKSERVKSLFLMFGLLVAVGCGRTGDGVHRRLSLGFDSAARPIAVGVELELAVEMPRERGHFCVGHCALDNKLEPLSLRRVVSSQPDRVEVLSLDDSDPRAPLVRIRTLAAGQASLAVEAVAQGRPVEDSWILQARPLSRFEVSQTRLPENARVDLMLRPVDADGHEVYAGAISARLSGAARLAADDRVAVEVDTDEPGPATLEVRSASRTQLIPLQVGPDRRAAL